MKWPSESWKSKLSRLENWHLWFAWHPVQVGEQMIWLERIERKGIYFWGYWTWHYRLTQPSEERE